MSVIESPVTTVPGVAFIGGNSEPIPQEQLIYTTNAAVPERIESVFGVTLFASNNETNNVISLQLRSQSGVVLYEQATPPLLGVDGAELMVYLTWSRLGNETAQLPAQEVLFATDNIRRTWLNIRLPELVLGPLSTVYLLAYVDDGGEGPNFGVDNLAVTVTRNAGAVSTTTLADVLPLLTPTDEG